MSSSDLILSFIFVFLFGISLGSFMNVLVYRIPNNLNIAYPPSSCPKCKNRLKWYHNIPLFSWIFLRGKCGFCKTSISIIYPCLELLTGLLAVYLYALNYFFIFESFLYFILLFSFFYLYMTMAIIDYKTHYVEMTMNSLAFFLSLFINTQNTFLVNLEYSFIGLGIWLLIDFYGLLRGFKAMGLGDLPILAGMAAIFGLNLFFHSLVFACVIGLFLFFIKREKEIPFIPCLALSTFIFFSFEKVFPTGF